MKDKNKIASDCQEAKVLPKTSAIYGQRTGKKYAKSKQRSIFAPKFWILDGVF